MSRRPKPAPEIEPGEIWQHRHSKKRVIIQRILLGQVEIDDAVEGPRDRDAIRVDLPNARRVQPAGNKRVRGTYGFVRTYELVEG